MTELDVINHRLDTVEEDIKILYKKINEVTLTQVQSVTKLDSMLVTLGELKESIDKKIIVKKGSAGSTIELKI